MKLQMSFIAITMMSTLIAQAKPSLGSRTFEIKNQKMEQHFPAGILSGTVQVNYDQKTVKMHLQPSMPPCSAGLFCAQVMPQPVEIELPIVSVKKDNCGVLEVTALKDMRPVDGALKKIQLKDATNVTCKFIVAFIQTASYETRFYSRVEAKEIVARSTMELSLQEQAQSRRFNFAEGSLVAGFPSLEKIGGGELILSEREVQMDLYIRLNCKPTQPCPKYMPAPVAVKLPVIHVEKTMCGDRYKAKQTVQDDYGVTVTEIEVVDYTSATCEIYIPHPVFATVTETDTSLDGKSQDVRKAQASFDLAK